MSVSHKDLDLSFTQNLLLKYLTHCKISKQTAHERYDFLVKYNLVDYYPKDHNFFVINEKGKMYLRHHRKDKLRFWIPVFISIIALLGGYDIYTNPLLLKALQAGVKLVKTILESLGAFF